MSTPAALWNQALDDLQTQMTRATFEQWLNGTRGLEIEGETLVVATPSPYAAEWLENRLVRQISSTLARHGFTGVIQYVVRSPDQVVGEALLDGVPETLTPGMIEVIDFDPTRNGHLQVAHYATWFWQPYLGGGPFLLWQTIRAFGEAKKEWPSIIRLAEVCAAGDKQRLIGRPARNQAGWLDVLENERILWYTRKRNHYTFRVLKHLPLLTPEQVAQLPLVWQVEHEALLRRCTFDYEEWTQLPLPMLTSTDRWSRDENFIG